MGVGAHQGGVVVEVKISAVTERRAGLDRSHSEALRGGLCQVSKRCFRSGALRRREKTAVPGLPGGFGRPKCVAQLPRGVGGPRERAFTMERDYLARGQFLFGRCYN